MFYWTIRKVVLDCMESIRVLIAEDNVLQRNLLMDGLDGNSGIQVVGAWRIQA